MWHARAEQFPWGPYVTEDACRRAVRRVVVALSQVGVGDDEDMSVHLDPASGFLSIDVINVLGAGALGIHVEGDAVPWASLQGLPSGAALVNWNNRHWTVLQRRHADDADGGWVHTNSILGDARRHGRRASWQRSGVSTVV